MVVVLNKTRGVVENFKNLVKKTPKDHTRHFSIQTFINTPYRI